MDIALLHGGGQGSWIWDETRAALELQAPGAHRVLRLDVPGCGTKRGRDTSAIAFPEIAAELVAEIEAAGLRQVLLVGHSQAGSVLPGMAALRAGLFSRLVYVSCVAPVPGVSVPVTSVQLHSHAGAPLHGVWRNPEVPPREQFRRAFCNDMGPQQAEAFLDRLFFDTWPESAGVYADWRYDHLVEVPSTYVLCLEDRILPPDAQEAFAARFHCDEVLRIEAGHQVQNTRPHALAELLRLIAQPPA